MWSFNDLITILVCESNEILPELAVNKFRIGVFDRSVDFIILIYISNVYLHVHDMPTGRSSWLGPTVPSQ